MGGIRTPIGGFGDRSSAIELPPYWQMGPLTLLGFAVKRALLFEGAELHELNALGLRLLVTCSRVIAALAFGAGQNREFTGHFKIPFFSFL